MRDHADTVGDGADIVNAETDVKIFIEHHRSQNDPVTFESFQKYTKEESLKSQSSFKAPSINENYFDQLREESKDDFDIVSPQESFTNDRQLLVTQVRGLIFESRPITIEQKGYMIQLMHQDTMRETMNAVLQEVGSSPRQVKSYDCLKLIGDIERFILTLFVHE